MTQEEKKLLLKDLSARLPYGVNGLITFHKTMGENSTFKSVIDGKLYDRFANLQESWYDNIPSIKPYLRPMSSMTEEEKAFLDATKETEYTKTGLTGDCVLTLESYDYLNSIHIDYRGLIPMGLAFEAKDGMYKIK